MARLSSTMVAKMQQSAISGGFRWRSSRRRKSRRPRLDQTPEGLGQRCSDRHGRRPPIASRRECENRERDRRPPSSPQRKCGGRSALLDSSLAPCGRESPSAVPASQHGRGACSGCGISADATSKHSPAADRSPSSNKSTEKLTQHGAPLVHNGCKNATIGNKRGLPVAIEPTPQVPASST